MRSNFSTRLEIFLRLRFPFIQADWCWIRKLSAWVQVTFPFLSLFVLNEFVLKLKQFLLNLSCRFCDGLSFQTFQVSESLAKMMAEYLVCVGSRLCVFLGTDFFIELFPQSRVVLIALFPQVCPCLCRWWWCGPFLCRVFWFIFHWD